MNNKEKLWGGRFTGAADVKFVEFNSSFKFDSRLFAADVRGCLAHCEGLRRAGILSDVEANLIQEGLQTILEKASNDPEFLNDSAAEDVHSFIETRLIELIGDDGRRLHTGRSRNDQVATAFRFWLRDAIDELAGVLKETQKSLLDLAEQHITA
ncbi:MAG TPA: lyase family protein, partial [Pyrinomonadaceae bacterium]|nr:lyase family protein [Pyrinomonadaceae bacterium]